jgi:uncharacterized protein
VHQPVRGQVYEAWFEKSYREERDVKIVLPGGSGQVGGLLTRAFQGEGHEVVVLSRSAQPAPWRVVSWDAERLADWAHELDGADVVINLAGRSVNCRYSPANREAILRSRVRSTEVIGTAIAQCNNPPPVWLQMSTATIYAHRYDAANDEATGIIGGSEPNAPDTWRFSIEVALAWERALESAEVPSTRKVALRSAMIMSPDRGGVFDTLLGLVRRGLGGRAGDGDQFVSWIHQLDFVRAVRWLIDHPELEGAVNLATPNALPQAEFMRILRDAWGTPFGLPSTRWMLELGAWAMRTETELILKSRRVVPGRLLREGFVFEFPTWTEAAADLCAESRRKSQMRQEPVRG